MKKIKNSEVKEKYLGLLGSEASSYLIKPTQFSSKQNGVSY